MVMQGKRVLTVEEARNLPPPTEEELAARRAVLAAAREDYERFIAAGGRPLSREEWQRQWEEIDAPHESE
jgi:hypothetical protein